jgi:hypothetical protein
MDTLDTLVTLIYYSIQQKNIAYHTIYLKPYIEGSNRVQVFNTVDRCLGEKVILKSIFGGNQTLLEEISVIFSP